MIFVTVGTDLPFDRLVRVVDQWAQATGRSDVFAQIGKTDYHPVHIPWSNFLEPAEFSRRFASASTIVAHAGMGTILSALQHEKPILVMPRRASLGEQRNEHQLATARRLSELGKVTVALDEVDLRARLDRLDDLVARQKIGSFAPPDFTEALRAFIERG